MKRKFTKLIAALALLVFMTPTMAGWGQSTVTFDATTDITATVSSYQTDVLTIINAYDGSTWHATGYGTSANTNIVIGKGGANYLETPSVNGTISEVAVTWSGNTSYYLALQTTNGTELSNYQNPSTSTTKIFTVSGSYSQLRLVGRRASGTSNAAATITKVVVTYTTSGGGGGDTPIVTDISGITAAGNYSVTGTVVAKNMYGMVIGDGTGYVFYSNGSSMPSYNIGANITIEGPVTVSGSSDPKLFQFTNSTATITDATSSNYNSNNANPTDLLELTTTQTTGTHLSDYYTFEGTLIKPSSYYIVEIGNYSQIQLYGPTSSSPITTNALNNLLNKKVTVTGYFNGKPSSGLWAVMPETVVENTAPDTYEWVPVSLSSLTSSDVFVIVSNKESGETTSHYAMSNDKGTSTRPSAVSVTISDDDDNISSYVTHNIKWTVSGNSTDGYTFYPCGSTSTWLYCTNTNDGVRVGTNTNKTFKIDSEYLQHQGTSRYIGVYNNADWRCYTSCTGSSNIAGQTFTFYKRQLITSDPTLTVSTNNINDFSQTVSGGPSVKSFTVGGRKLETAISIALGNNSSDFELSFDENAATWQSLLTTSAPTDGTVANTTVYVRMKANLSVGSHSGSINVTCGNLSETVSLNGTVNPDPVTYTYTAASSITPGKHYIIVGFADANFEQPYAMAEQKSSNRGAISIASYYDSDEDEFSISSDAGVYEFVISGDETNKYSVYDTENNGYLYATKGSNALNQQSTLVNAGKWSIANDGEYDNMDITVTIDNETRIMRFNYSSNNQLFSCYASGQKDIYLYERTDNNCHIYSTTNISDDMTVEGDMNIHAGVVTVEADVTLTVEGTLTNTTAANLIIEDEGQLITNSSNVKATVKKIIAGHGDELTGWNFIASPISTDLTLSGLITDNLSNTATAETATYDLYYYDEDDNCWRNYRRASFNMNNSQGYLYASKSGTIISFAGTLNATTADPTIAVTASSASNNLKGFNLVGNPFARNLSIGNLALETEPNNYSAITAIYKTFGTAEVNGETRAVLALTTSEEVGPCEGFFIKAGSDGTLHFNHPLTDGSNGNNKGNLKLEVMASNRDAIMLDRAYVNFGSGNAIDKFSLYDDVTKLYIPQNGRDFALIFSEGQGTMPVSFRAAENGTYTLTVNPEGVEMNYLHLIDNMTGNDIDLLMTPSYSFEATTNDYENRFRLVFAAGSVFEDEDNANFAFCSNGNWIINNVGEATLQVIDINGRILSSERVNGSVSKTINGTAGVYMLRLINGEKVMVQKIVVR